MSSEDYKNTGLSTNQIEVIDNERRKLLGVRLGDVDINEVEYYFATDNNFNKFIDKYLKVSKVWELINGMSDEQKIALDIKHTHPLDAKWVVQTELLRFVTDADIAYWNSLENHSDTELKNAVDKLMDGVVSDLDTLNKIAKSINDDPHVYQTINTRIDNEFINLRDGVIEKLDTLNKIAKSINDDPQVFKTINNRIDSEVSTINKTELDNYNTLDTKINTTRDKIYADTTADLNAEIKTRTDEDTDIRKEFRDKDSAMKSYVDTKDTNMKSYVDQRFTDLIDGSPEVLDTLNEFSKALGDDPNFATTITKLIGDNKTNCDTMLSNWVRNIIGDIFDETKTNVDYDDYISMLNKNSKYKDLLNLTAIAKSINWDTNLYTTVTNDIATAINNLKDNVSTKMDTLNKLSTALQDNPTFGADVYKYIDSEIKTLRDEKNTNVSDLTTKINTDIAATEQKIFGTNTSDRDFALNTLKKIQLSLNGDTAFDTTIRNLITSEANTRKTNDDAEAKTRADAVTSLTNKINTDVAAEAKTRAEVDATKVDKVSGYALSKNDFTDALKTKLDGIATNANNYTHPSTHAATMITQDSTHRFVTDSEKSAWNAKSDVKYGSGTFASGGGVTTISHGLGSTPSCVMITPTANSGGAIGEYWVTNVNSSSFQVGNTGSAKTTFYWVVYK